MVPAQSGRYRRAQRRPLPPCGDARRQQFVSRGASFSDPISALVGRGRGPAAVARRGDPRRAGRPGRIGGAPQIGPYLRAQAAATEPKSDPISALAGPLIRTLSPRSPPDTAFDRPATSANTQGKGPVGRAHGAAARPRRATVGDLPRTHDSAPRAPDDRRAELSANSSALCITRFLHAEHKDLPSG